MVNRTSHRPQAVSHVNVFGTSEYNYRCWGQTRWGETQQERSYTSFTERHKGWKQQLKEGKRIITSTIYIQMVTLLYVQGSTDGHAFQQNIHYRDLWHTEKRKRKKEWLLEYSVRLTSQSKYWCHRSEGEVSPVDTLPQWWPEQKVRGQQEKSLTYLLYQYGDSDFAYQFQNYRTFNVVIVSCNLTKSDI